jgi:hypothetical protein
MLSIKPDEPIVTLCTKTESRQEESDPELGPDRAISHLLLPASGQSPGQRPSMASR